jgi:N-acetylmuramoyl-L-alanine amidase
VCSAWIFRELPEKKPFAILLEAAGDNLHAGRTLGELFESSFCWELAQQIKQNLEQKKSNIQCLLNRVPGQSLSPLANQNYANKLSVDLYVSINAFYSRDKEKSITLYQFSYHDTFILKENSLSFYPYDKLYLINESVTKEWTRMIKKQLATNSDLTVKGPYCLPFKPLIGIKAPAVAVEVGVTDTTNIQELAMIISTALAMIHEQQS